MHIVVKQRCQFRPITICTPCICLLSCWVKLFCLLWNYWYHELALDKSLRVIVVLKYSGIPWQQTMVVSLQISLPIYFCILSTDDAPNYSLLALSSLAHSIITTDALAWAINSSSLLEATTMSTAVLTNVVKYVSLLSFRTVWILH